MLSARTSTRRWRKPLAERLRTCRSVPVALTDSPILRRRAASHATSPVITTSIMNSASVDPQFTASLMTGVPAGVVRTSGALVSRPQSSTLIATFRL